MTPRLALACVLTAALVPTGLSAQHAKDSKEETKPTHAAAKEDAAEHAPSAKHESVSSKSTSKESAKEGTKSQSERAKASAHEEEEAPAKAEHGEKKSGASARESARGGKEVAEAHDKEEKESESAKGKSSSTARGKAATKNEPKSELEAALKRIDDQISVMRAKPEPADARAAARGRSESRAESRPVRVAPPAAAAPARVHLSWRTTLLWTNDLDAEGGVREETPHVGLVWTPEPIPAKPVPPLVR